MNNALSLQYAILHALMGFHGPYAQYQKADEAFLKQAGVAVTPLDPIAASVLEGELQQVRTARNFGVPSVHNRRKPISISQMAERHKRLVALHAGQVKKAAPAAAPAPQADDAVMAEKRKLDARFDGSAGPKQEKAKAAAAMTGPSAESLTANAPSARAEGVVPGPGAARGHRQPGLFGMLGALLKGLLRTIVRVAQALFS